MYLNPAELLIFKARGVRKLSTLLKIDKSSIILWKKTGIIPSKHQKMILKKLQISPHEIIYGKEISDNTIFKSRTKFLLG